MNEKKNRTVRNKKIVRETYINNLFIKVIKIKSTFKSYPIQHMCSILFMYGIIPSRLDYIETDS